MKKLELRVWGSGVGVYKSDNVAWQTYESESDKFDVQYDIAICLVSQKFEAAVRVGAGDMEWRVMPEGTSEWRELYFELVEVH